MKMTVKPYDAQTNFDDFKSEWHESKYGSMVKYEDYALLAAENADLMEICQGQGLEQRIAAEKRAEAADKLVAEMQTSLVVGDIKDAWKYQQRITELEALATSKRPYQMENGKWGCSVCHRRHHETVVDAALCCAAATEFTKEQLIEQPKCCGMLAQFAVDARPDNAASVKNLALAEIALAALAEPQLLQPLLSQAWIDSVVPAIDPNSPTPIDPEKHQVEYALMKDRERIRLALSEYAVPEVKGERLIA